MKGFWKADASSAQKCLVIIFMLVLLGLKCKRDRRNLPPPDLKEVPWM